MYIIRKAILAALHARLSSLPATFLRDEMLPERVPAAGLVILRDGEPEEPEVTLSPLRYHYQHRAEIDLRPSAPIDIGTDPRLRFRAGWQIHAFVRQDEDRHQA